MTGTPIVSLPLVDIKEEAKRSVGSDSELALMENIQRKTDEEKDTDLRHGYKIFGRGEFFLQCLIRVVSGI